MKILWLMVTRDELELPMIVEESAEELAKKAGVSVESVLTGAWKYETGKIKFSRYRRIEVDDDAEADGCALDAGDE